jgi:hypothetical protein
MQIKSIIYYLKCKGTAFIGIVQGLSVILTIIIAMQTNICEKALRSRYFDVILQLILKSYT